MTTNSDARNPLTIGWIMVQIVAAVFVMLGILHVKDAVIEADPSKFEGSSNLQELIVLGHLLQASLKFAIGGSIFAVGWLNLRAPRNRTADQLPE